uniref:Flocculation protein FLO11-like n=1 Tax=Heterorhabditis bacteriophora TaxID=37862 RepID=A0A1I7WCP4_HETBA
MLDLHAQEDPGRQSPSNCSGLSMNSINRVGDRIRAFTPYYTAAHPKHAGSQRLQTIGRVDQKYVAKIAESKEEDVMADQIMENPTEALIESIGPGCLSLEEQESCYIETESAESLLWMIAMTSTVLPILCLMDWHSPKCRLNGPPPPRFAPNYNAVRARSKLLGVITVNDNITTPAIISSSESEAKNNGFFAPVLPSTATDQRRATNSPPKGELATVDAVYRVSQTTATTTTTINTRIQSTTAKIPPVIYLSQMDEFESSGNDSPPPILQLTPATKPLVRTALQTRPSYPLKLEPVMVTTIRGIIEEKNNKITVLPRPYDSVKHAVEENPEYLGESIWSDIDLLPEPMITGPAWRTHLTRNTTLPTTTTTTTTTIKAQTTQTTLSTQPTMKTRKKSTIATSLTTRITSTTAHHSTTKMTLPPLTSGWYSLAVIRSVVLQRVIIVGSYVRLRDFEAFLVLLYYRLVIFSVCSAIH